MSKLLPQPLPQECRKATKILQSFVKSGSGLDGMIPREVLQRAKGFAIFSVVKAGFLFSARAGTGIVIARLDDGSWSAPSAIGTAGMGFGGQAGAEMTEFLIVLNSRSAVKSFMAAGSLTLGGNLSLAIGPLGRNGEASGTLSTKGKLAAMYSYSRTKGLFGGISIEGSVIVERQDANAQAYHEDVSSSMLLSGQVEPPPWAEALIRALEAYAGGKLKGWVEDRDEPERSSSRGGYAFEGVGSESPGGSLTKKKSASPFPSPGIFTRRKTSVSSTAGSAGYGGYFDNDNERTTAPTTNYDEDPFSAPSAVKAFTPTSAFGTSLARAASKKKYNTSFETHFESDFDPLTPTPISSTTAPKKNSFDEDFGFPIAPQANTKRFSPSTSSPMYRGPSNPFQFRPSTPPASPPLVDYGSSLSRSGTQTTQSRRLSLKQGLLDDGAGVGVGRAIALYDFSAQQSGDLGFKKGDVIIILKKSDSADDWWTGRIGSKEGIFPANFVEVV